MARFRRLQVLNTMVEVGLVPVFFNADEKKARQIILAIAKGGSKIIEFTNRGDHAWEIFTLLERFCTRELPEVILGVGSIIDAPTAAIYINCGANFVVGPILNREVARLCNRRKIAYSGGCGSVSEISQAEELGCEIVKIFPGSEVGGPSFVKAVLGPCPWTSLMPTGGVEPTQDSLTAWFKAGVVCVGMGSNLISRKLVENEDWEGISQKIRETLAIIKSLKSR